eukprot:gene17309-19042_t
MKFNFVFGIVVFLSTRFGFLEANSNDKDAQIKEAKELKTEYNTFRLREGTRRLKDAFPDQKKFGRILQWILFEQICLTDGSKSCYALSDFSISPSQSWNKFENWLSAPYSTDMEPSLQWYERLYNSVAHMLLQHDEAEIKLSLGTKSGHGVGEADCLPITVDIGIGNTKTFSKGFITGDKLDQKVSIKVLDSFNDMKKAVKNVLKILEEGYDHYLSKISA